jgi:hypothetical protein
MKHRQKMRIKLALLEDIIDHKGNALLDGTHFSDRDVYMMKLCFRGGFAVCIDWLRQSGFDIGVVREPEDSMGDFTRMLEEIGI